MQSFCHTGSSKKHVGTLFDSSIVTAHNNSQINKIINNLTGGQNYVISKKIAGFLSYTIQ